MIPHDPDRPQIDPRRLAGSGGEGELYGLDLHEHGFPAYPEYVVTGDDGAPKTIDDVPIGRRTLARPARKMKSVG